MLTPGEKFFRVMVYGTLGVACIAGLIAAIAQPDKLDVLEVQLAAVYLTLLVGSIKAFNAKPIFGFRSLGVLATFTGTGLLPATIIHVAVAQIELGHISHSVTLIGHGIVGGLSAFLTLIFSWAVVNMWQTYEERYN